MFPEEGTYEILVDAKGYMSAAVQQVVVTNSTVNIALNKPTLTSDNQKQAGSKAVDGNKDTRWESDFTDEQFITVDLKSEYTVSRVVLNWENAAGKNYTVQVSLDGKEWKTVYTTTAGKPGVNNISFAPEKARYVKMNGTARTSAYGYSLWEFEVYGTLAGNIEAPELTADTMTNVVGKPITITFADDEAWRKAIKAVKLNGKELAADKYSVAPGTITFDASVFPEADSYDIVIEATGYMKAALQQIIFTKSTVNLALNKPTLTAADQNNPAITRWTEIKILVGSPHSPIYNSLR